MNKLLLIGCLISFTVFTVSGQKELLPKDNEVPGWTLNPDTDCDKGDANDSNSLYLAIDGGADVYLGRGFVSGCFRGYKEEKGDIDICIRIFDQDNAANAKSVYEFFKKPDENYIFLNDIGDAARIDNSFIGDYVLEMIHSKYYFDFKCVKDDKYKEEMIKVASTIAGKITPIVNPHNKALPHANEHISIEYINHTYLFEIDVQALFQKTFQLPEITINDSKGRRIRTLPMSQGILGISAIWDGKNRNDIPVAQGVYTATIRYDKQSLSKKFVVR